MDRKRKNGSFLFKCKRCERKKTANSQESFQMKPQKEIDLMIFSTYGG